jgi:hypothetical protein
VLQNIHELFHALIKRKNEFLVDELFGKLRSSEKRIMPHTNFCKSMTILTIIKIDEEASTGLNLLLMVQTDKGMDLLTELAQSLDDQLIVNMDEQSLQDCSNNGSDSTVHD